MPPAESHPSFQLQFAGQGQQGFEMVKEALSRNEPYALAFIDIRMPPGWDGMETAARIRRIDPNLEIVIVTAYSDRSRAEIVESVGAPDKLLFLRKPFDAEELTQLGLALTAKWNLGRQEQRQRTFLEAVLAASPAAIFTTDNSCRIFSWNQAAEAITGHPATEAQGNTCILRQLSKTDCKEICVTEQNRDWSTHELEISAISGESKTISITARPIRVWGGEAGRVVAFWDISLHKEMEQWQRQAQKLEALGTLSGGIAHDLNNMLTPVLGYSQLARAKLDSDHPVNSFLDHIEKSASKAATLIRQILIFSRKQAIKPEPIDLNRLINDLAKMLERLIREDINLQYNLAPDLWPVSADRSQIEQIVMNLAVNARDAQPEGGEILISTSNEQLDGRLTGLDDHPLKGDFVLLSVRDKGVGMDEKTAQRIFDPFFTTKEAGQGTGMGLSTVLGIVRKHEGDIRVETAPGRGTTFFVYLPKGEEQAPGGQSITSSTPLHGDGEAILVAEDSPDVRKLTVDALESVGYRVSSAPDGQKALKIFKKNNGRFDLLLADLVMPGMNGKELARKARKLCPGLPVLFITGYGFEMDLEELQGGKGVTVLAKPFSLQEISTVVRDILSK